MNEKESLELEGEGECLNKVFAGTMTTLRGIKELLKLGLSEEESQYLVYKAYLGGRDRRAAQEETVT
jgi:uncharacterized protein (UPF0254 family)